MNMSVEDWTKFTTLFHNCTVDLDIPLINPFPPNNALTTPECTFLVFIVQPGSPFLSHDPLILGPHSLTVLLTPALIEKVVILSNVYNNSIYFIAWL